MNSTSSNPSDADVIRRLLMESGVGETRELSDALLDLRAEARMPAPEPSPELEAFFTPGVTPLKKISRRRGYMLGGAIIAAMAAGTTGVAATNGGLWITAEDTHDVPAPVEYEQVPAPVPAPTPIEPDPATLPPVVPATPVEPVPVPAEEAPVPGGQAPEEPGQHAGKPAESGWNSGSGRRDNPGHGSEADRDGFSQGQKGQDRPGRPGGNNGQGPGRDKGQDGPGRGDAGKDGNRGHGSGRD